MTKLSIKPVQPIRKHVTSNLTLWIYNICQLFFNMALLTWFAYRITESGQNVKQIPDAAGDRINTDTPIYIASRYEQIRYKICHFLNKMS